MLNKEFNFRGTEKQVAYATSLVEKVFDAISFERDRVEVEKTYPTMEGERPDANIIRAELHSKAIDFVENRINKFLDNALYASDVIDAMKTINVYQAVSKRRNKEARLFQQEFTEGQSFTIVLEEK